MTWITIHNVRRAVIPKAGNAESRFLLCFVNCIIVIYFCIKFHKKYLQQFSSYRLDTNILQKSLFSKFKGP